MVVAQFTDFYITSEPMKYDVQLLLSNPLFSLCHKIYAFCF